MSDSPVRTALRDRLRTAVRERDRPVAAALRSAIAALENAEAVQSTPPHSPVSRPEGERLIEESAHVAGSVAGLGAAEAQRLVLDAETEMAILRSEVDGLLEAAAGYERLGRAGEAGQARAAAEELARVGALRAL